MWYEVKHSGSIFVSNSITASVGYYHVTGSMPSTLHDDFSLFLEHNPNVRYDMTYAYFDNEHDALAFKIRWGK